MKRKSMRRGVINEGSNFRHLRLIFILSFSLCFSLLFFIIEKGTDENSTIRSLHIEPKKYVFRKLNYNQSIPKKYEKIKVKNPSEKSRRLSPLVSQRMKTSIHQRLLQKLGGNITNSKPAQLVQLEENYFRGRDGSIIRRTKEVGSTATSEVGSTASSEAASSVNVEVGTSASTEAASTASSEVGSSVNIEVGTSMNSEAGSSLIPDQHQLSRSASHIEICKIVLLERDSSFMNDRESCLDEIDTTRALAQIFLSSYLTAQAQYHGYPIEYEHGCKQVREEKKVFQEVLPSPLDVSFGTYGLMTKDYLQHFCRMIVKGDHGVGIVDPLDILLWDTRPFEANKNETPPISLGERLILMAQNNLYTASMESRFSSTALTKGYGVLKGRDFHSDHIAANTATIYLPCVDHQCTDIAVIPYFNFIMHLPLSVRLVDILVSQQCFTNNPGCENYVNDLASTLRQFSPYISVEVITSEPSSPNIMARLIESEHTMCGPGYGMLCLFPSLARTDGRVTLFDHDSNADEKYTTSSFISRLPLGLFSHVNPPESSFPLAFLNSFENRIDVLKDFTQKAPEKRSGSCRFLRGHAGSWSRDLVYAQNAQYREPLRHYSGEADKYFREKVKEGQYGDMQFRPPTTYRWFEGRYKSCGVTQINQESFCQLMKSLSIRRIFIMGDSSNFQFAQSIWMWLTNKNYGESPSDPSKHNPNFKTTIQCFKYEFDLQFIRNDELTENDKPVDMDEGVKNCKAFCYPWTKEYLEDERRTIMIFNTGTHMHTEDRFKTAIDNFIGTFDNFNRTNDVALFRTIVPGHWGCDRPGLKPYSNYAEYKADVEANPNPNEAVYGWNNFELYNSYIFRTLNQRRFSWTGTRAKIEALDVTYMTMLRPDGHISDEFKSPNLPGGDCLHYSLPGPVDWWTHMAYSHLLDIAAAEQYATTE